MDKDHTVKQKIYGEHTLQDHTSIGCQRKYRELSMAFFVYFSNSFNSLCSLPKERGWGEYFDFGSSKSKRF